MFRPDRGGGGIWAPERIALDLGHVEAVAIGPEPSHLDHVAGDPDLRRQRGQSGPRHPARRHPRRRLARRGPAATPRVADAVLLPVGDVGMTGAELLRDLAVVLRPLVGILDHQLDRGAGRAPLVGAGEDAHRVRLAPLRGVLALPRLPAVEPVLDHAFVDRDPRRTAIDGRAQGRPVAFAPCGDAKKVAEGVEAHGDAPVLDGA